MEFIMKTLLISAVIATLASASASYAATVQDRHIQPQAAVTQTVSKTYQKAQNNSDQMYPHEHHRNEFTG
jgi:opacity protein-like surface antigen